MGEGQTTRVRTLETSPQCSSCDSHSYWALFTRLVLIIRGPELHAKVTRPKLRLCFNMFHNFICCSKISPPTLVPRLTNVMHSDWLVKLLTILLYLISPPKQLLLIIVLLFARCLLFLFKWCK